MPLRTKHSFATLFLLISFTFLPSLARALAMQEIKEPVPTLSVTGNVISAHTEISIHISVVNRSRNEVKFIKTHGGSMPFSAYQIDFFWKRNGKLKTIDYSRMLRAHDPTLYNSSDQIVTIGPDETFEEDLDLPLLGETAQPGTYRIKISRVAAIGEQSVLLNGNELTIVVKK